MAAGLRGPVLTVLLAGEVVCLPVAYYAVRNRDRPGARLLAAQMGAVALWMASAAVLVTVPDYAISKLAMYAMNAWMNVAIVLWILFVVEFTGHGGWLDRRRTALVAAEPAVMTAALLTNDLHGLFYGRVSRAPENLSAIGIEGGPLIAVHAVFVYPLVLGAVALLAGMLYRADHLYRGQALAILVATLAPWVGNALYLFDVVPFDVTPGGFVVSGLAFLVAIARYEFVDLRPVARETVLANVREAVVVLDGEDRVVDANPAARALLGVDDPVGSPAREAFRRIPAVYEALDDAGPDDGGDGDAGPDDGGDGDAGGDTVEVAQSLDGGTRHFDVSVSPTPGADDGAGRILVIHEVTDRRRRRRELERRNEHLDRFASMVSHDLRNPLNVAQGRLQLARETGDTDHVAEATDAYDRMHDIIEDVLVLAREGDAVEETEPVDLGSIAREGWGNVDTGDADLVVASDLRFRAGRARLLRLFENCFRNAIEHGGTSVTVEVGALGGRAAGAGGPRGADSPAEGTGTGTDGAGFYVADDGPGIDPGERDRVFEDGYTTGGGTGLGLSIVASVCEAHGWEVSATGSESGGARFEVTGVDALATDEAAPRVRGGSD